MEREALARLVFDTLAASVTRISNGKAGKAGKTKWDDQTSDAANCREMCFDVADAVIAKVATVTPAALASAA